MDIIFPRLVVGIVAVAIIYLPFRLGKAVLFSAHDSADSWSEHKAWSVIGWASTVLGLGLFSLASWVAIQTFLFLAGGGTFSGSYTA